MSDEEKWVKAYEKFKREGMLAPAVDYEEFLQKVSFRVRNCFYFPWEP